MINKHIDIETFVGFFNNGYKLAYFSKYDASDPTEMNWSNNGPGVNENTYVCLMDEIVELNFEHPQLVTEQQMEQLSWCKWKDLYDLIDPTCISGTNANSRKPYHTINGIIKSHVYKTVTLANSLFEITATSQPVKRDSDEYEMIVYAPKGKVSVPIVRDYNVAGVSLHSELQKLIKKVDYIL